MISLILFVFGTGNGNSQLIDFTNIPEEVTGRILNLFETQTPVDNIKIQYFIDKNIQNLIEEFA